MPFKTTVSEWIARAEMQNCTDSFSRQIKLGKFLTVYDIRCLRIFFIQKSVQIGLKVTQQVGLSDSCSKVMSSQQVGFRINSSFVISEELYAAENDTGYETSTN